jgi:2-desacetyl-2-hydroxyethyl bacteriochlorophyllide A dehydrogenase
MAELLAVPVSNLVGAPGLTAEQCATVEFLSIGAHAVRRGGVTRGDRVLVVGAGPIGLGVAMFAQLAEAEVTVLDRDTERMDAAAALAGASSLHPSNANSPESVDDFDAVFDASGNKHAMEKSLDRVAHGGRCIFVSLVKESITFSDPDFHRKEMSLFGSRNATSTDFQHVIAAIRAGQVPVDQLITHRTSLANAARDIPLWAQEKGGLIKALIDID